MVFQNNILSGVGGQGAGGLTVDDSVRYNDDDSPRLYRTPSAVGNRRKGSLSLWYKRCNLGSIQQLFNAGAGDDITFNASDKLTFTDSSGVSYITTQVFRDGAAWGHLLFAWDTSLATAGDRLRIYHNGVEITAFDTETNPDQNDEFEISNTVRQTLGANESDTEEFDGYLSQVYLVDGSQLTPASFGETDDNGVWRPIEYEGTDGSAVTLTYVEQGKSDSSATTYTFSGVTLGGTSSDHIIIGAVGRMTSVASPSISSITVDGVAAVEMVNSAGSAGYLHAGLWIAEATGDATGDVVIVFGSGCNAAAYAVWRASNVGQIVFDTLAVEGGSGVDPSGNISIPAGGALVCLADTTGGSKSFTWTNATEVFDADAGDGDNYYSGTADTFASQTIDRTITVDQGSTTSRMECASIGPTVAYGTNGFFLDFADSSALGNDVSGNNNDYTSAGLAANDQMTDTPTKNWCTLNGAAAYSSTLSNGNLRGVSGAAAGTCVASIAVSSGKWYFEMTMDEPDPEGQSMRACYISQSNTRFSYPQNIHGDATTLDGQFSGYWGYNGNALDNDTAYPGRSYGDTYTDGDVVSCALDLDNMAVWWGVNGTWQASATEAEIEAADTSNAAQTGLAEGVWFFVFQGASTVAIISNFGQSSYAHDVPDGFLDFNTANIGAPAVLDGTANFQTTLYTGDGSTRNIDQTENSTFQPDWVWIKNRSQADGHKLIDITRGVTKEISSDSTAAESTDTDGLTSFDSDGFGLGTGAGGYNDDTESFVAWQWLAGGGAGSSNTAGSINTTTTTVNTTSGCSISTYTGDGNSGATIGHGLGAVPKMILIKKTSALTQWTVYNVGNTSAPETEFLVLDKTNATSDYAEAWADTAPTSTLITLGSDSVVNANTATYVIYAFADVEGFSCFGSYRGNSVAANGPIVYTGFKPAYVMIKNSTGTGSWFIYDSQRSPYNEIDDQLLANTTAAETTGSEEIDFLSSGFKIRTNDADINYGTSYYIYAAFASNPFGGDGASPVTAY